MRLRAEIFLYWDDDTVVGWLDYEGQPYARKMQKYDENIQPALAAVLDDLKRELIEHE